MTEVKSLNAEALGGNLTHFSSVTPNLEQYENVLKEKNDDWASNLLSTTDLCLTATWILLIILIISWILGTNLFTTFLDERI